MRVLVVDDDPVILRLLQLNLELEGHEAHSAGDGEQAIAVARELRPDAVLLDVMMPQLDGFGVCKALREDPTTSDLRIVFVSAKAQPADLQQGAVVGADAYVTKPFDPLELIRLVESIVAGEQDGHDDMEPHG